MSDSIARAVRAGLRERGAFEGVAVDGVTVGRSAVLVELRDDDHGGDGRPRAGVAHRPPGSVPPTEGETVESLASWAVADGAAARGDEGDDAAPARAVGVATLNALSAPHVDWRDGDPMALLSADVETVTTVGLFGPAFRKFDAVDVRVVERRSVDAATVSTPPGVTVSTFTADELEPAMDGAAVVFVTGSTLVYGGLARSLAAAPADATVVVVGATGSTLPGPLFDAGADVVAGAAVDDPEAVSGAIRAGACGTDLHDAGLRKGYVAAAEAAGIGLDGGERDTTDTAAATDTADTTDTADATNRQEP